MGDCCSVCNMGLDLWLLLSISGGGLGRCTRPLDSYLGYVSPNWGVVFHLAFHVGMRDSSLRVRRV